MIRRPPRSTLSSSSAASDVYKRQGGYKAPSKCDAQGGGFAGAKVGGAAKGNLDSIGFVMKIRGRASGYTTTSGSFNSSTAHRSIYVQRAVASKPGMVTSDIGVSGTFNMRQIVAAPGFTPDGATHGANPVSYTHLRAHETPEHLVCRLLLEKKKKTFKSKGSSTIKLLRQQSIYKNYE
eukprot:TRINITY_DN7170_c0_g1_i3.p1 TRINITY_DN7170_c0_g1~~TRINITY_DN7170_c0_g1_i3.p1  ORF type:complete len:179 (+),score=45.11 TRINITY_DN7170_c0_g1_i3:120-656(+)